MYKTPVDGVGKTTITNPRRRNKDLHTDIVIIGAGSGMVAALSAWKRSRPIIEEKLTFCPWLP